MTEPITPYVLTTFVEPAPSPSDPPDAPDVYRALGVAMVAWGRLEGHFTLTTIALLNLGPRKQKKFPMKWGVKPQSGGKLYPPSLSWPD